MATEVLNTTYSGSGKSLFNPCLINSKTQAFTELHCLPYLNRFTLIQEANYLAKTNLVGDREHSPHQFYVFVSANIIFLFAFVNKTIRFSFIDILLSFNPILDTFHIQLIYIFPNFSLFLSALV